MSLWSDLTALREEHSYYTIEEVWPWDFGQNKNNWLAQYMILEVRGDCSFCWYWRNCWPSLFKLSFHKLYSKNGKIKLKSTVNFLVYFHISYGYNYNNLFKHKIDSDQYPDSNWHPLPKSASTYAIITNNCPI